MMAGAEIGVGQKVDTYSWYTGDKYQIFKQIGALNALPLDVFLVFVLVLYS